MAEETVCFSGCSSEDIEFAKTFWQHIYPSAKPKSALVVTGIDHRLRTAPKPQNAPNYAHQSIEELKATEVDPALHRFKQDAEKQKANDEEKYRDKMRDFRQESQNLIQKRRKERTKKEEISSKVLHQTHDHFMDISDSEEDEDARQAMEDIEKFEARLRQQEKLKPS